MTIFALSWAFPPLAYPRSIQVARMLGNLPGPEQVSVLHGIEGATDEELLAVFPAGRITGVAVDENALMSFQARARRYVMQGRLLVPDAQRPWARRAAGRFIGSYAPNSADVLVTYGQPMSDHLAGLRIVSRYPLPWVAHFSDPWVDSPYRQDGPISGPVNRRYERHVIGAAHAVIFTSEETRSLVMAKYPTSWSSRAYVIPHAYDATLFPAASAPTSGDRRFVARYLGNFYGERGPEPLFEALARLAATRPELASGLRVELIGGWEARYQPSLAFSSLPEGLVEIRPRVGYLNSLRLMREADLLLLVDAAHSSSVFLPSKLIEYIGAARPILALTPPGTAASLVTEVGGWVSSPEDPGQSAALLADLLAKGGLSTREPWGDPGVRERFAAPVIGRRFAEVIAQARIEASN